MDMKTYRFGVLGAGSMGKTIAAGAVRAGLFRPDEVLLFNRSEEKRAANRAEGYAVTGDFTEVYTACDTVLLSVKPQNFAEVLPQLAECKRKAACSVDCRRHFVCEDRGGARRRYPDHPRDAEYAAHARRRCDSAREERRRERGAACRRAQSVRCDGRHDRIRA